MRLLGIHFEYRSRHFTVVILTITIMIGLLALGFGLASARSVVSVSKSDESINASHALDLDEIRSKLENSTLFENSYDRAVQVLSKYPIVDG